MSDGGNFLYNVGPMSNGGIPVQTLLPSALGCRITGRVDEKAERVSLRISCEKDAEVIAWWPQVWGEARVTEGGKYLKAETISFGEEHFLRFAAGKGDWEVVVQQK